MKCDYCNGDAWLVSGVVIYPHRPDLHGLKFYYCADCRVAHKDIPGCLGYRAGTDGSIWGCLNTRGGLGDTWRRLKPQPVKNYLQVNISVNKVGRHRYVHHLVLTAFVGPRPYLMEACHFDNDPRNNRLDNLRWDTSAGNAADMVRAGNSTFGEKNPSAKLTTADVIEIRKLRKAGADRGDVARQFNVCRETISRITGGKIWKHLLSQSAPTATSQQS